LGAIFSPGPWYAALQKPGWTPPDWVFPPVWSLLYIGIALAGWLLWSTPGTREARIGWCVQLLMNGLWSWIFFGLHQPLLALFDIALLLAVAIFVAWSCVRSAPWVSLLFTPYIAWVGYAATLNAGVWWLNR
jgi:tryptophan-rich sensory protein